MKTEVELHIAHAEPLDGGVFIEFSDGKSALFPASFLRDHLPWYELDMSQDRHVKAAKEGSSST